MKVNEQYVYIYRDPKTSKIKYAGRGKSATRASSHQKKTHNSELENWLKDASYKLEIAGPYENEQTAIAVEEALISTHQPEFNMRKESSKYSFRPLGVPEKYITRLEQQPLEYDRLFKGNTESIILVKVTDKTLGDRVGYNLVDPPSDDAIVERVEKYWQLGNDKYLGTWIKDKKLSPTLILGITGSPGNQVIIASLEVDISAWDAVEVMKKKLITVPLKDRSKLDKHYLRGYRIALSADIKFGRSIQEHFRVIQK